MSLHPVFLVDGNAACGADLGLLTLLVQMFRVWVYTNLNRSEFYCRQPAFLWVLPSHK